MSGLRCLTALGLCAGLLLLLPVDAAAQAEGAVAGRVSAAPEDRSLAGAEVLLDNVVAAVADTAGRYRIRSARAGWHRLSARFIGYRGVVLDSVFVRAGATIAVDFTLESNPQELAPLVVTTPYDGVLDPFATATEQTITASDLRDLPVSSLEEAVALSAGAIGTSYRGGRIGEESFIIDGLGLKNRLDASSGGLGIQLPPDFLSEASLATNGFSARYGQALSGMVNVVTREPEERWEGRLAYESDRPLGGALDRGLDRFAARAGGPLWGRVGLVVAADVTGRLDADPVSAPLPTQPLDPRSAEDGPLPHNSGEQWSGAAKLVVPVAERTTVRLLGLHSEDQRLLFDPAYKYDPDLGPAQRLRGDLVSGHVQYLSAPQSKVPTTIDLRVSRFVREFFRGDPAEEVDYALGAITGSRLGFIGEDFARRLDTSGTALPGVIPSSASARTPYGVPAYFFLGFGPRGNLGYNRLGETRAQLDGTLGFRVVDLYAGGEISAQQVRTYQRVLGAQPVGGDVPPPAVSAFSPRSAAGYLEAQARLEDLAVTAGLRYDRFDAASDLAGEARGSQSALSPRFAVSTVLRGATVVASFGRFVQAPDYQFLVDAAFDDTTRTGRFRRGNPDLGFETATQYELSVRVRPRANLSVRAGAYVKRLDGLVASVPLGLDPDSTVFGNADAGSVRGFEVLVEREMRDGVGLRLSYNLQEAEATATDPFLLNRLIAIDPVTGDTVRPSRAEFPLDFDQRHTVTVVGRGKVSPEVGPRILGVHPIGGLEAAVIFRAASGLPYTPIDTTADSTLVLPNSARLPWTNTVDLLVRRPLRLGRLEGGLYVDVRNLLNRRNVFAVRRDTGSPAPDEPAVEELAEEAYQQRSEPIPFESIRYRSYADLNGDGFVAGREELYPMYLAAARDYLQPLFAYGPPRLMRLGVELLF